MAAASLSRPFNTGIYEIVNTINGKRYVGSALKLANRWSVHRCRLSKGKHHNRHLQAAWNKHGAAAFRFGALIYCERKDLLLYEQIALDALQPQFNVERMAGNSLGCTRTAETRAKIAAKALGRVWTDEAKAKLSATTSGRKLSEEHRQKLLGNKHAAGLKHSAEWKAKNSALHMGRKRPKDAEYRAKIAASLKGRKATPEHRKNQSAAQLGKKRGPYKKRCPADPPPTLS